MVVVCHHQNIVVNGLVVVVVQLESSVKLPLLVQLVSVAKVVGRGVVVGELVEVLGSTMV